MGLNPPQPDSAGSVTVCDLSKRDLECKATSMIGPPGRVFYVAEKAVYVWMTEWARPSRSLGDKSTQRSMVARMRLLSSRT